jgi:hypothetical protein
MIITVTLLDIKTLEVKAGADMRINDVDDAYDRMDELVAQTVAAITGGSPAAPIQTGPGGGGTDTYKVGDRGPTGGHIFYDKGVYINGWRYLEAAPVETEFTAAWGAYNNNVSGTAVALGTGKRNTQFIVDYLRGTRETGTGAQLSASLNFDGHSDWFLPSKDELNLMYVNLKQKGLGDFQDTWYLSSSQDDDYVSVFWLQHFGHGQQGYEGKPPMSSVRAVRAF